MCLEPGSRLGTNSNMSYGCIKVFFILFYGVSFCLGSRFPNVFHIINTLSCTMYSWNITAGGIIAIDSVQNGRTICSKTVFGISINPSYTNRVNCSFHSATNNTSVELCFFNITHQDSGEYVMTTPGQQQNGTIYVMDKPTTPMISPTSAKEGASVDLRCNSASTSTPSPTGQSFTYTWTVNGSSPNNSRFTISGDTLTIERIQAEDRMFLFQCVAKERNGLSSERSQITLSVILSGSPTLTSTETTIYTGRSITFTCTFPSVPGFLGMAFISSVGNSCGLLSMNNGSCRATAGLCTGNSYSCSADGMTYNFTLVNVNVKFNLTTLYCQDSFTQISSNVIQLTVLSLSNINIISLDVLPSNEVNETFRVRVTCQVNSSEYEKLTWIRNHGYSNSNEILRVDRGVVRSDLDIYSAKCEDSGNYTCQVSTYDCKPRVLVCENGLNQVYFETDGLLNITITVVSNPPPTITFLREINSLYNTSLEPAITIIREYIHSTISFILTKATSDDEGMYYLIVKNDVGSSTCVISVEMRDAISSENNQSDKDNTNTIIISVVISVLLAVGICIVIVFWIYRKRKKGRSPTNEVSGYNDLNLANVGKDDHRYSTVHNNSDLEREEDREYSDLQNTNETDGADHQYSNLDTYDVPNSAERMEDRLYLDLRSTNETEKEIYPYSTLDSSAVPDLSATYANTALDDS